MALELHSKADEIDRRGELRSRLMPPGQPSFQNNNRG
jgi:hypothetical protein